jgi:predicted Zn-dependent protease
MKLAIAVTSISFLFLMISCEKTQEVAPTTTTTTTTTNPMNSTGTTTTNPTNTTGTTTTTNTTTTGIVNNTKPTNQEIYDAFVRLALKNSSNTQSVTIRKWASTKTQIKVYWDGGRTATLFTALDKVIADMNSLNKYNKMVRTEVASEADITINRVDAATHNAKYASYQITNTSVQGNTFTAWSNTEIMKAVVWLSPTAPASVQNGVLRHELTHALGLGHIENTKSIMVAVMSGANYDFNNYSTLDQRVLQILADIRVKQGMNEASVSAVIKEYAAK